MTRTFGGKFSSLEAMSGVPFASKMVSPDRKYEDTRGQKLSCVIGDSFESRVALSLFEIILSLSETMSSLSEIQLSFFCSNVWPEVVLNTR